VVAHAGWLLTGDSKHNNTKLMSKYARTCARSVLRLAEQLSLGPAVVVRGLLFWIGGLPLLLWGICFRVVFGLHATWLVNSATHLWASPVNTRDDSRNKLVGSPDHVR